MGGLVVGLNSQAWSVIAVPDGPVIDETPFVNVPSP